VKAFEQQEDEEQNTGWRKKKRPEHSHALWSKLLTDF